MIYPNLIYTLNKKDIMDKKNYLFLQKTLKILHRYNVTKFRLDYNKDGYNISLNNKMDEHTFNIVVWEINNININDYVEPVINEIYGNILCHK